MRVGLFVTCLVDLMRPSIGFAALRLLEAGGATVVVPSTQTCCGQPAYNSGDRADAKALAAKVVAEFEDCDFLVAPSGSCSGMIRTHYADLFADDPAMLARIEALAAKTRELTDFLVSVLRLASVPGRFDGTVTYHDSCSGLREMGVKSQPRVVELHVRARLEVHRRDFHRSSPIASRLPAASRCGQADSVPARTAAT